MKSSPVENTGGFFYSRFFLRVFIFSQLHGSWRGELRLSVIGRIIVLVRLESLTN